MDDIELRQLLEEREKIMRQLKANKKQRCQAVAKIKCSTAASTVSVLQPEQALASAGKGVTLNTSPSLTVSQDGHRFPAKRMKLSPEFACPVKSESFSPVQLPATSPHCDSEHTVFAPSCALDKEASNQNLQDDDSDVAEAVLSIAFSTSSPHRHDRFNISALDISGGSDKIFDTDDSAVEEDGSLNESYDYVKLEEPDEELLANTSDCAAAVDGFNNSFEHEHSCVDQEKPMEHDALTTSGVKETSSEISALDSNNMSYSTNGQKTVEDDMDLDAAFIPSQTASPSLDPVQTNLRNAEQNRCPIIQSYSEDIERFPLSESDQQMDGIYSNFVEDGEYSSGEEDGAMSDELDEEEIDALLEQPLKDQDNASKKAHFEDLKEAPNVRDKIVLKHRNTEYFEVLPDGWIEITHASGIPVYLHKPSRVCTLSRPYFIGPGSVRHHEVPLVSVPCLYQRKVHEEEKLRRERRQTQLLAGVDGEVGCSNATGGNSYASGNDTSVQPRAKGMLEVKVHSTEESKARNLTADQLHEYCTKAFEFETIKVWRFRNWSDHRTYHRKQKQRKQRPALPANVKLITVPALEKGGKPTQKQFFLNPHGKTSVSVLHEYVQRVMHCSPVYEYMETENATNPYSATVVINGTKYATGYGNSKKNAKLNAARRTLAVLIPDVDFNDDSTVKLPNQDDVLQLFDLFSISDSRVAELSVKAGQPNPYQILLECLRRNAAFGKTDMKTNIKMVKHQQHEYTMTVGKHEVKVICTNKRDGKQKAAQAMLEKLHPEIKTWGSLLRLYGYGSQRKAQNPPEKELGLFGGGQSSFHDGASGAGGTDKKGDKNSSKEKYGMPNKAILDMLKKEMLRLHAEKMSGKSNVSSDAALVNEAIKINIK